jgi:ribosome biogenesis GTPase A
MAKVRYSFSSRRTRRIDNIRKQRQKYPDLLLKVIETSDIILEVLDARFPKEMRNKEIEELIKKKKKIIIPILNKADLMENPKRNSEGILISCANRAGIKQLRDTIKIEAKKIRGSKENNFNRIQIGVIGYPNSGKSSLINLLTGKNSAKTGAEAGFTKGVQKLRLTSDILLLDSPGVIPESHYSSTDEEKMAKTAKVGGKSFSQIKEPELAVTKIMEEYSKEIENYYKIKAKGNSEELIEKLGRKKGFLTKGNKIDEDKTSRLILKDFQEGNIKI